MAKVNLGIGTGMEGMERPCERVQRYSLQSLVYYWEVVKRGVGEVMIFVCSVKNVLLQFKL